MSTGRSGLKSLTGRRRFVCEEIRLSGQAGIPRRTQPDKPGRHEEPPREDAQAAMMSKSGQL